MTDEMEINDSLNVDETQDSNLEEGTDTEVEVEADSEKEKLKQIAHNQKVRAEKAEAELKALKKTPKETETPKNEGGMSIKDIRALQDVADEDVDEVVEYAKFKGISIAEAKKTSAMQSMLRTRVEERATANATSTQTTRRSSKETEESIVNDFHQGREVDPQKLAEAELALKRKAAKRN